MPEILFGPVPHKQAVSYIKDKPVVSRSVFSQLLPELQGRAFAVSGIESVKVLQSLRDRIADLPAGADWDQIKGEIVDQISPFIRAEGETTDAGETQAAAERRAELLLRTHGYQAYNAAQYEVMNRQKDVFRFWRYQTAHDDRVRDAHAALDGIVLPADDPFWQTHFPPWDFNCRCQVVPLSDDDVADIKKEDAGKPADQRSILDDATREQMNKSGFLIRGPNVNVDVRVPRDKGRGDGYAWQPGDMKLSLAELQQRYDPESWAAFRTWAKQQKIGGGAKTVWAWMGGSADVG